jgi:hypothetical protein
VGWRAEWREGKRKRREWRVGEKKPEISQKAVAVHFRVILDTDT